MLTCYTTFVLEISMTPATYDFAGNANTFIGAIALFATPVILYWIFKSYWNSPLRK